MSHNTVKYQKLSQALAKKVRAQFDMTDELYQLLTVQNARLRDLEEMIDEIKKNLNQVALEKF